MSVARVAKRDGREVPFDEDKIRGAVERALVAAGEEDPGFAVEVAALVRMTLEQRAQVAGSGAARVPHIEEIQDLVEQALIELGRAAVAKTYIVYRDRRARIREALTVRGLDGAGESRPQRPGRPPTVQDSERSSAWSKGRIVAALMDEAELARDVAEAVAARVEARVFALGQRSISTGLIRELVDGELFELGLDAALRRQTSVGVPLHDLRRILSEPPAGLDPLRAGAEETLAERSTEARVAAAVLRRHALAELLPESAVEDHLAGDLEVVGLSSLHRPLFLAVPAALLLAADGSRALDAFALLEPLATALRRCVHGVVIEDAGEWIDALGERSRAGSETLTAWICALSATAHAAGRRVELAGLEGRAGARGLARLEAVLRALDSAPESAWLPRVFVGEQGLTQLIEAAERDGAHAEGPALTQVIDRLLAGARLIPTWDDGERRVVGPGCERRTGEPGAIACGAALALNLPRLALRAGPWREDRMLEGLAELVARGVDALAGVAETQQRALAREPALAGTARARTSYALVPVGLREALAWLGDGEVRPEQGARLLGFLGEHLQGLSRRSRLSLVLSPFFGERARERFARLDGQAPQHAQRLLFDEGVGAGLEPGQPYGAGFRLSPTPGFVPWSAEAELLRTVAAGALHPLPHERARGAQLSLGEAWTRFARLRREPACDDFGRLPELSVPTDALFDDVSAELLRELRLDSRQVDSPRTVRAPRLPSDA